MESNQFNLKEKITYYKKKWKKDNVTMIVITAILWIMVVVSLKSFNLDIMTIIYIASLLAIIVYVVFYNRMMKYVEENAYKEVEKELSSKSTK